jgi:xylose isomerase
MSNCFDMKCPECGTENEIDVQACVWVRLCYDGTDIFDAHSGDHEWNDNSAAICCACAHEATVREFRKPAETSNEGTQP